MRNRDKKTFTCGQIITAHLCCSFLLIFFPCSSVGPPHCGYLCASPQSSLAAAEESLVPRAPSVPPASLTSVSAGLLLTHFSQPSLSTAVQHNLPFLKYVFWEVPHPQLRGSAMPWSRSVGASCDWHMAALAPSHRNRLAAHQHLGSFSHYKGLGKN